MARKKKRTKRRVSPWQGTLRLGMVFSILLAINFYFFFLRGGTSLRALVRKAQLSRQAAKPEPAAGPEDVEEAPPPKNVKGGKAKKTSDAVRAEDPSGDGPTIEGRLAEGETLEHALRREGLSPRSYGEALQALVRFPDAAGAGPRFTVELDGEHRVRTLEVRAGSKLAYRAERSAGGFRALKEERAFDQRTVEIGGIVQGSLFESFRKAGADALLAARFADLFAGEVNFYADLAPGDRFKVIVEKHTLGREVIGYGPISAAELKGRAGTFRAFWFQPSDGRAPGYFNEYGESSSKRLVRSPLKLVRISPAIDRLRFTPLSYVEKERIGADFPGPAQVPVWALGPGRITRLEASSIVIQHGAGLESQLSGLGRIAHGLSVGQLVQAKQVIGYLGPAGSRVRLTLLQNGVAVDPVHFKAPREAPLTSTDRIAFADAITSRLSALAAINLPFAKAGEMAIRSGTP